MYLNNVFLCVMVLVCSKVQGWNYVTGPIGICRSSSAGSMLYPGYYSNQNFIPNNAYNSYSSQIYSQSVYQQGNGFIMNPRGFGMDKFANPFGNPSYNVDYFNNQPCNCRCNQEDWVCANDGLSYVNICALDCEIRMRSKPGLGFRYMGPCQYSGFMPPQYRG